MNSGMETVDMLNKYKREQVKEINTISDHSTEYEPPLQGTNDKHLLSDSLTSLSESVSMSDWSSGTKKDKSTNMEWEAADREYMDIYSDEGANDDVDLMINIGMGFIQLQDDQIGINQLQDESSYLTQVNIIKNMFLVWKPSSQYMSLCPNVGKRT